MKLLLDTQALVWWSQGDRQLSKRAAAAIADSRNTVAISAFSAYELHFKASLGKLPNIDLDRMAAAVHRARFREAPFSFEIALAAAKLPLIHRDPFDRLILAQARADGSTIVSSDSAFQAYGAVVLW